MDTRVPDRRAMYGLAGSDPRANGTQPAATKSHRAACDDSCWQADGSCWQANDSSRQREQHESVATCCSVVARADPHPRTDGSIASTAAGIASKNHRLQAEGDELLVKICVE